MKAHITQLAFLLLFTLIGVRTDAAKIEVSQELAAPNTMVTVSLTISELPEITTSIQGSLTWDESLITLMNVTAEALPQMTFNTEEDAQLGFVWFDGGGTQLPGTNDLISLTFQVAGDATGQRAVISFSNNPTPIEVAGEFFEEQVVETINGYIDIADALPVELVNFKASTTNDDIQLAWATESEINFEGFEIQRSIDGANFSTISWLNARGNEAQGANYAYTDSETTASKTYYYRLQMRDFDGSFDYSNVVSARIGNRGPVISVYPNPTYQETVLAFDNFTEIATPVLITIYDNMGRSVQQLDYEAQTGKNTISLNVNHLSTGMYTIRLEQGEYFATRKLVIQ